jgi:1-acyl-sn-glycerol-3-phosphate acyltransferase
MVGHAALAALILRIVYPRAGAERRRALLRWWSGKLLRILNVSVRVDGPPPPVAEAGKMIAANHVSWLDIFVLSSVQPTRFIAKGEIRDWPIAGWIAHASGTIFIRREQWRDTRRSNEKVGEALAQGDCVGLFPEGFTTAGDKLLKFHSAMFEPAVANRAHVHPAALRYEEPDASLCRDVSFVGDTTFFESVGLIIGRKAITARVHFASAIDTEGFKRRDVTRGVEERVATLLGLTPAGTSPARANGPPAAPR